MDKNRKRLKEYSIVILILVAFSVVRMIVDACLYGFGVAPINVEGVSEDVVKIAAIIFFVLGFILFVPDVYVGLKGLKEADNPTGGRAHIIWSFILAVLAVFGTVSAVTDIVSGFTVSRLFAVLDVAVDALLFFAYFITAKKVANE